MTDIDGLDLISPRIYGERGIPHDQWSDLRRLDRLHFCEPPGFDAFYPVVRHEHICEISKQPDLFLNRFGIVLESRAQKIILESNKGIAEMRVIIGMDPPEHREFRKVAVPAFTPRGVMRFDPVVRESARNLVDGMVEKASGGDGECEFATEIAAAHPLRVLSTILGVPRELEPQILRLTNELFGADDQDLQREGGDRLKAVEELGKEFFLLFSGIIQDRRANPRDDLASLLANGQVNGEPMGLMETLGYYLITFSAGHDTTKNALAGGICALARNPGEFEKLKNNPELIPSAVEEIVRWTSPVNYMKRVVAEDLDFHGQKLRKGDNLVLFYGSANRDESVFEDPFTFRVDRKPNPHLGFGIGEHFCLGSHLARASQRALLHELVNRIDSLELTGEPEQIQSSFVVGLKKLPLRYRVSQAA
ncbi:MAG: cytochrome P450 [Deltaproteobacteria bacterium]|nr:cytochrome P450 [Deltaproteobacteria bacterium]MBW2394435.1 cytochrome P450 [Deltaproteobacteria bacterium]